ncbi:MAG: hypothetical protein GT600_04480 [Bacteroidales bacterium]|nr:hypothetical protein [Bacteroidales bacterium]
MAMLLLFSYKAFSQAYIKSKIIQPDYKKWEQVKEGMAQDEVEKLLGAPIKVIGNPKANYLSTVYYGTVVEKSVVFPMDLDFVILYHSGKVYKAVNPFMIEKLPSDGIPSVPKPFAPQNNSMFTVNIVDLRWFPAAGKYPMRYEIEIELYGHSPDPSKMEWVKDVTLNSDIPFLSYPATGGKERWRVRAINDLGESNWSEYQYFELVPPTVAVQQPQRNNDSAKKESGIGVQPVHPPEPAPLPPPEGGHRVQQPESDLKK